MESNEIAGAVPQTGWSIRSLMRPRYLIGGFVLSASIAVAILAVLQFAVRDDSGTTSGELLEAPVTLGDLVESVSSDGTIVFAARSGMSFGTAGSVNEVLVEVGDSVTVGQELASLDPLTTSHLSADVEGARIDLESALDKLQDAQQGASALEIARAQEDLTDAQSAVDALLAQPDRELLDATAAVTKAELALSNAREALSDLQSKLDPESIADAEIELTLATEAYDGAVANLALVERDWDTNVEDATTALADARASYITEFEGWFGVTLTEEQTPTAPTDLLANWGATYESIFVRDVSADLGTDVDDPQTPWNEFTVSLWTRVFPFGVDATCDSSQTSADVPCVQEEVEDAWTAIGTAEDALAKTSPDRANAVTVARKAITTAETAMQIAEESAAFASASTTTLELQAAAETVAGAESDLTVATGALTTLTSAQSHGVVSTSLAIAEAELNDAQINLSELTSLNQTLIALRTAEAEVAQAQLDEASTLFDSAILKSPVDGVIDAVNFSPGDEVQRNAVIVEVIDPTIVTVEMEVAQVDILAVAIGAEASLTLEALPGQVLNGNVTDIGAASGGQTGSVTFPVVVTMQVPTGITLIEGLTANADMITSLTSDVLLVPSVAVGGSFTQPTVDVLRDDQVQTVAVSLGGGNETFAVIGSGLIEGETVLFRLPGVTEDTNPFSVIRAGVGGFGGGRPTGTGGGGGFTGGGFSGGGRTQ